MSTPNQSFSTVYSCETQQDDDSQDYGNGRNDGHTSLTNNMQSFSVELSQPRARAGSVHRHLSAASFRMRQTQERSGFTLCRSRCHDEPARFQLPIVTDMSSFKSTPDGSMYRLAGGEGDKTCVVLECMSEKALEGPSCLYQETYNGAWVFETGIVSPDKPVSDDSIITYRPQWLSNGTFLDLRHFGEVSVCLLSVAKASDRYGSNIPVYRLSTFKNHDVAIARIMLDASQGISTNFVSARVRVQGKDEDGLSQFCGKIGMQTAQFEEHTIFVF